MRRGSLVQLILLAALIGGLVTLIALLIPWLPVSASEQRERIDLTFWVTTGISIFVFALVAALLIFAVVKFRARPDDDTDGPPIHGHTGLEVMWTAVPAVLVTAIAVLSGIVLTQNEKTGPDTLQVDVVAQQFVWSFTYRNGPAEGVTAPVLRLPVDRTVKLKLRSRDVIHSFWVPQFGQKLDALPWTDEYPHPTYLVITPNKAGTYPVICTELCGLGHSLMRTETIVMRPAAFERWASTAKSGSVG